MRHSIRFKMTFLLTVMIVFIIALTWIVNRTFLSGYYMYTKKYSLNETYNEVANIYNNSTTAYLSDEETEKMERLELKYDVDISVYNKMLMTIYPAPNNIGEREAAFLDKRIVEYLFSGSNPFIENKETVKTTEKYNIYSLYDVQTDLKYMDLVGTFYNPNNDATMSNLSNDSSTSDSSTSGDSKNNNSGSSEDSQSDGNTSDNSTSDNSTSDNSTSDNSTSDNSTSDNSTSDNSTSDSSTSDNSTSDNSTSDNNTSDNNTSEKNNQNSNDDITKIKDNNVIIIRTNVESIKESAAIANEFFAYIGIAAVLLGSAAMLIISRRFTKPILELAGISKKMADLDFDVKYNVNSKDELGELGGSINILSDKLEKTITELKQANNELMTDIQKKTEIDEMRKEFLSNVSHELKTPISLIQGYAEGLKENINEDPESRDFYCEVIMDEASKMNQMVKKLLSLNELEFGNSQVNFERFDIVALIQSVLNATEILFKQKEVTLYFERTEPVFVWADEYLIEQVVTNYISNALNHVNGQKIIEIKLIPHNDAVRVAVFNTGDNIPEEDLDKIWIKFYKVDKARTREYGGSGIGLSIVKAIMNSHNRECGVINRQIGVEFWFELDTKS